jgi:hypothetical protein
MPREGAITLRDIVGKLTMLRVDCTKCDRKGQYRVDKLIARYGLAAKLFDFSDDITKDCPRKIANNFNDLCGARCPDLSKVVLLWGSTANGLTPVPPTSSDEGVDQIGQFIGRSS